MKCRSGQKYKSHHIEEERAAIALSGLLKAEASDAFIRAASIHIEHGRLAHARNGWRGNSSGQILNECHHFILLSHR